MGKGRPQQPEMARSGNTPLVQDDWQAKGVVEGDELDDTGGRHRTPPANRRGNRPDADQDKPKELGGAGHGPAADKD